ncbi:cell division protein ZapA [Aliiroseovarius sp. YM-037]|uniref:cell division protein ZapA n=1 Tax=Aliiroseovarius sp. YM-037 TaxID=3341728 RepID=UPI003A7FB325
MPDVTITIGGRNFEVACQEGEEHFLQTAAKLLDTEASVLTDQIGRMPETRMLLMAGLMLADKTAGLEEKQRSLLDKTASQEQRIQELESRPTPAPEKVEVAVIPPIVTDTLAEIAARAEAIAARAEEKVG